MTIVTVGTEFSKNVFAVHCVDATGKPVLVKPAVPRVKLAELIASLPPCLISMEAMSAPTNGQKAVNGDDIATKRPLECQKMPSFEISTNITRVSGGCAVHL